MEVPIYEPSVGIQAPGIPEVRAEPMTPAVSSANVSEATAGIGKGIEELGARLEQHMVMQGRMEAQQQVYDRASQVQKALQDKAYGDGGWLTRQGASAKGITYGTPGQTPGVLGRPTLDPDSFEGVAAKLKAQAMSGMSPYQSKQLDRLLDSHITVMRGAVVRHEADQTNIAQHQSMEAQVTSLKDTGIAATNLKDFNGIVAQAQDMRHQFYAAHGATPEALILSKQQTADEFADAFVHGNYDRHPQAAQQMIDGLKGTLSNAKAAELQNVVDGKMLDLHRHAVWSAVSGLRHPDGTANLAAMEAQATKLAASLPEGQRDQVLDFVRSQASMTDAALRDTRQSQDRQFYNEALSLKSKNIPHEQAEQILFKQKGYGYDSTDRDAKTQQLQELYDGKESFYDAAAKHQTGEQKLMWKQIEDLADAKYGKKTAQLPGDPDGVETKLKDSFIIEMRHQLMGMAPGKMWETATNYLKDVVVEPHWYHDTKKPAWMPARDARVMGELQSSAMDPLRDEAQKFLIQSGKAATPEAVEAVIKKMRLKAAQPSIRANQETETPQLSFSPLPGQE